VYWLVLVKNKILAPPSQTPTTTTTSTSAVL
jgi:hypothetical protein